MRLFLDTSVLLAACGSISGASSEIFRRASANRWVLITTPYVLEEIRRNLPILGPFAGANWERLLPKMLIMDDILTLPLPVVFATRKDRPILFGALAWADILLTLDRADFGGLFAKPFYGLIVLTPALFLERERDSGRLL